MAPPNRSLYRLGWRIHKVVWKLSGGRLGARSGGMPVLQLTTTGRKSGEPRSVLLPYLDHPDGWVVIGSNLGSERDPAWWLNLQAEPQAAVLAQGVTAHATAVALAGTERTTYWDKAIELNQAYLEYPKHTDRAIPLVLLRRS